MNSTRFSHIASHLGAAAACGIALIITVFVGGCHNAELWDEMPEEISQFITRYFPGSQLEDYGHGNDSYHVRLDNGPGLTFDNEFAWTAINGYGMPLPQVLLFDRLPPRMYNYIQETEQLNGVFAISRDNITYTATLIDNTITYNIRTGTLTGSDATKSR